MTRTMLAGLLLVAAAGCGGSEAEESEIAEAQAAVAPAPAASVDDRVFEMRTYTAHPGRLDDVVGRFREHSMALFERHGITNIGYWTPMDSARADNTLVYMLAYPSRAARDSSWGTFLADPDWLEVRANTEANGPIVQRIEAVFLTPTDFSAVR